MWGICEACVGGGGSVRCACEGDSMELPDFNKFDDMHNYT